MTCRHFRPNDCVGWDQYESCAKLHFRLDCGCYCCAAHEHIGCMHEKEWDSLKRLKGVGMWHKILNKENKRRTCSRFCGRDARFYYTERALKTYGDADEAERAAIMRGERWCRDCMILSIANRLGIMPLVDGHKSDLLLPMDDDSDA